MTFQRQSQQEQRPKKTRGGLHSRGPHVQSGRFATWAIDKPAQKNRGQIKMYCPKTSTQHTVPEGFQVRQGDYNRTVVVRADKNGGVIYYTTLTPELPEQTLKFETPQNLDTPFLVSLLARGSRNRYADKTGDLRRQPGVGELQQPRHRLGTGTEEDINRDS